MSNAGASRVLTLVFSDLADSTGLKTRHGDTAIGKLIARHREHVAELSSHFRGDIIDWAGDGCFLVFDTSSAAVTFALRLQQIHHFETDLPGVRIGIHMGEVSTRPLDGAQRVEGLAVDLAARISGLALPGQVLLSDSVYHSAKQRLGIHEFGQPIRWEAYGDYTLKGFDEPVDIREAGLESLSPFTAPPASDKAWPAKDGATRTNPVQASSTPIRKLAVLPLTNLSGDPQQEYFVDAMTEAIITELAKIKALRVISRTSVMRYKRTTQPLMSIAEELGVDGLVEGSVLRAGNDVRITAQLIRGDSDEHLWAEHYDGSVENILKLQKDIALSIADQIQVAVTADERVQLRSARRIDPAAYDRFLKAARFGGDWTPASISRSLREFEEVRRLAPNFSGVYTLIATAYYFSGMFGYTPSSESFRFARQAARRALRLDDGDAGAQTALGWIALAYEWDWDEARYRLDRAMALNPSNYFVYTGLGILHALAGNFTEAKEVTARAIEFDPNNPPPHHNLGLMRFWARDYEGALEKMRDALGVNSGVFPPYVDGTIIASCAGEHDLARRYITTALEVGGPQPHLLAFKGFADARAGRTAEAEDVLSRLAELRESGQVLHHDVALVNIALERFDAALDALEAAHRDREYLVVLMGISPVFDPLRSEPRFQRMIDDLRYSTTAGAEVTPV
jgi:adenylate cyclase